MSQGLYWGCPSALSPYFVLVFAAYFPTGVFSCFCVRLTILECPSGTCPISHTPNHKREILLADRMVRDLKEQCHM